MGLDPVQGQTLPWWLTSRTILGAILAVAGGAIGWDLTDEDKAVAVESVLAVVGGVLAIYGRYKAQRKIGG